MKNSFFIKTFGLKLKEELPKNLKRVILPEQVHGTKVVELKTGKEDLSVTDGMITGNSSLILGIATADCAPVAFWEEDGSSWGIAHIGWRGLVAGLGQKMLIKFDNPQVYIGPFLEKFEIQKDDCYFLIKQVFGDQFFQFKVFKNQGRKDEKIFFDFKGALSQVFPKLKLDGRNTFDHPELASWRRDRSSSGRNITIISANSEL